MFNKYVQCDGIYSSHARHATLMITNLFIDFIFSCWFLNPTNMLHSSLGLYSDVNIYMLLKHSFLTSDNKFQPHWENMGPFYKWGMGGDSNGEDEWRILIKKTRPQ